MLWLLLWVVAGNVALMIAALVAHYRHPQGWWPLVHDLLMSWLWPWAIVWKWLNRE